MASLMDEYPCDRCHKPLPRDKPAHYESPDNLPGHDYLLCHSCWLKVKDQDNG
jgi:hypothetical protein